MTRKTPAYHHVCPVRKSKDPRGHKILLPYTFNPYSVNKILTTVDNSIYHFSTKKGSQKMTKALHAYDSDILLVK